jgi:hypothetical protein
LRTGVTLIALGARYSNTHTIRTLRASCALGAICTLGTDIALVAF